MFRHDKLLLVKSFSSSASYIAMGIHADDPCCSTTVYP